MSARPKTSSQVFSHLLPLTALLLLNYQGQREAQHDAQIMECWKSSKTIGVAMCLRGRMQSIGKPRYFADDVEKALAALLRPGWGRNGFLWISPLYPKQTPGRNWKTFLECL